MKALPVLTITSLAGSHLTALEVSLDSLSPGSLVIEHGAGLYSSPLFAARDVEIVCIETNPGWSEWAGWLYSMAGRAFSIQESWKRCADVLDRAALVFIDGEARHRGDLLRLCLERGVPLIVAHDTQSERQGGYGYHAHYFEHPGYAVTHDALPVRTTVWRRA